MLTGTVISWIGLLAYSLFFFFIYAPKSNSVFVKQLQFVLILNVILASLWQILSNALAGNWAFNFENRTFFYVGIGITALIILVPIFVFIIFGINRIFK